MIQEALSIAAPRPEAPATRTGTESRDLPTLVRASVCASGTTTEYLRDGAGGLVVLLGESFTGPARDPLIAVLAKAHRVVVPDVSVAASSRSHPARAVSSWLRSFLDGLGATEAAIVARDNFALTALAFALTDADRISRLVLCFGDAPDPLEAREPLVERLEEAQCRLLVVRESHEPQNAEERVAQQDTIVRFLGT